MPEKHPDPVSRSRPTFTAPRSIHLPPLFVLILLVATFAAIAAADDAGTADIGGMYAFDLLPVTNSRAGLLEVSMGPSDGGPVQKVNLLVSLGSITEAVVDVPVAAACGDHATENWNIISSPAARIVVPVGDVVSIKWRPTVSSQDTDGFLGLMLRKGRGDDARNYTIASEFQPPILWQYWRSAGN